MEKIDAFFVFLLIIAIIMAPLQNTGYAAMQSGMMGEGMEGYQYQAGMPYTFNGHGVVKSISPDGKTGYSIGGMPLQVHTNQQTYMNVPLQMVNTNPKSTEATLECYRIPFNDFEGGNFDIAQETKPYASIEMGVIGPNQTISRSCPGNPLPTMEPAIFREHWGMIAQQHD